MVDNHIEQKLGELIDVLRKGDNDAYVLGYLESYLADVMTAFVPARDRYAMLDAISVRIIIIKEGQKSRED